MKITIGRIVDRLIKEYELAKINKAIHKPMAYALYRTRQYVDEVEKERKMTTSEMLTLLNNMLIAPHTTTVTAYRTGLKEMRETVDKYRWHDMRKDPNDLPEDMSNVQVCWMGGSNNWYDSMFWDADRKVFSIAGKTSYEVIHSIYGDDRYTSYGQAIAWREIEPFEGSEE